MDQKYHVVAINNRTGGRYELTDEPVGYDEAQLIAHRFGKRVLFSVTIEAVK